jgi:hypothetical protein
MGSLVVLLWIEVIMKNENKTVEALNTAFVTDPNAIYSLMSNRVPCNEILAEDPLVQVIPTPCFKEVDFQCYQVGALGLINAVLEANGLPRVATRWSDVNDSGESIFLGFCEYNGEPVCPDDEKPQDQDEKDDINYKAEECGLPCDLPVRIKVTVDGETLIETAARKLDRHPASMAKLLREIASILDAPEQNDPEFF